jgi:S-disulfanyl-L-cysteine oxidoreductase SoxD
MTKRMYLLVGVVGLAAAACGGSQPEPKSQAATTSAAPQSSEEQVAMGQKLYAQKCAECHGANGSGSKDAPAVVGQNALPAQPGAGSHRKIPFATAQDVAAYVKKSMPADAPGTLSDEEAYAILAFDLHANGIALDKKVDATYAGQIRLH